MTGFFLHKRWGVYTCNIKYLFNASVTSPFVRSHIAQDRLFDGAPCDSVRHNLSFWDREGLVYDKSSCRLRVSRNWPGDCYSGIRRFDVEYQPLISGKRVKKVIGGLFFTVETNAQTTLEEQLRGVESYNIINTFLDPVSHRPSGNYLSEHKPEPRRIDEVAYRRVSDVFYRRHVSQIVIAYMGAFGIYAVYIKSPNFVKLVLLGELKLACY